MTGITQKDLSELRIVYFHCGPLQKLFADKRQNKRKVTLNPMILNEQQQKNKKQNQ